MLDHKTVLKWLLLKALSLINLQGRTHAMLLNKCWMMMPFYSEIVGQPKFQPNMKNLPKTCQSAATTHRLIYDFI